jgi:hypothetical protein
VRLCRRGSCCPIVEKTSDGYSIVDDFGGRVKLTEEQFNILQDAINHFKKKEEII